MCTGVLESSELSVRLRVVKGAVLLSVGIPSAAYVPAVWRGSVGVEDGFVELFDVGFFFPPEHHLFKQ